MILYLSLGLCATGAAYLVYRHDLYDREPWFLLLLTTALGALAINVAGRLEEWTFASPRFSGTTAQAAAAATYEELGKVAVVAGVMLFAPRWFNDPMDGIVYGSMSGLGMAIEESVASLRGLPHGALLPPEEVVRICGHLVMGGLGGFALGMAWLRRKGWPAAVLGGFLAAFTLHFGWDLLAASAEAHGPSLPRTLGRVAVMLAGLVAFGLLLELGSRWSRDLFAPTPVSARTPEA